MNRETVRKNTEDFRGTSGSASASPNHLDESTLAYDNIPAQENVCPEVRSRVEPQMTEEITRNSADFSDANDKGRKKKSPFRPLEFNTITDTVGARECTLSGRKLSQKTTLDGQDLIVGRGRQNIMSSTPAGWRVDKAVASTEGAKVSLSPSPKKSGKENKSLKEGKKKKKTQQDKSGKPVTHTEVTPEKKFVEIFNRPKVSSITVLDNDLLIMSDEITERIERSLQKRRARKKKLNRNNTGKITRESLRIVSKQNCKKKHRVTSSTSMKELTAVAEAPKKVNLYDIARQELDVTLKRLQRHPLALFQYDSLIRKMKRCKVVEAVTDWKSKDSLSTYLLHSAVIQTSKKTVDNVCVCFDKCCSQVSERLLILSTFKKPILVVDRCELLRCPTQVSTKTNVTQGQTAGNLQTIDTEDIGFLWLKNAFGRATKRNIEVLRFTSIPFKRCSSLHSLKKAKDMRRSGAIDIIPEKSFGENCDFTDDSHFVGVVWEKDEETCDNFECMFLQYRYLYSPDEYLMLKYFRTFNMERNKNNIQKHWEMMASCLSAEKVDLKMISCAEVHGFLKELKEYMTLTGSSRSVIYIRKDILTTKFIQRRKTALAAKCYSHKLLKIRSAFKRRYKKDKLCKLKLHRGNKTSR